MNEKLIGLLKEFYKFSKSQLGFSKPIRLFFKQDQQNAKDILGKTAYYDPQNMSIAIYVADRHPKDILRSFSHELVHHNQNCNGAFDQVNSVEEDYIVKDKYLREIEREAFEKGNLILRDFEASQEKQQHLMEENRKMMSLEQLFELRNNALGKKLLRKFALNEVDAYEYDEVSDEAQAGTIMIPAEFAEPLHHWHSGMGDPIYKVGSMAAAQKPISIETAMDAKDELERLYDVVENDDDRMELDELIAELGRLLADIF